MIIIIVYENMQVHIYIYLYICSLLIVVDEIRDILTDVLDATSNNW